MYIIVHFFAITFIALNVVTLVSEVETPNGGIDNGLNERSFAGKGFGHDY